MSAPCMGCKDRELLCHSSCYSYKEYKKDMEIVRHNRAERNIAADIDTRLYESATGRKVGQR